MFFSAHKTAVAWNEKKCGKLLVEWFIVGMEGNVKFSRKVRNGRLFKNVIYLFVIEF